MYNMHVTSMYATGRRPVIAIITGQIWRMRRQRMIHKNKEGYPDPTAGRAIKETDRQPDKITWYIKTIREIAELIDLEIVGRVTVKDKDTGKIYR